MIYAHITEQDALPGAHRALQSGFVVEVYGEFDEADQCGAVVVNSIINWETAQ